MRKTDKNGSFYIKLVLILLLPLFAVPAWTAASANIESVQTTTRDIRVVIDMSGSMKKNDPNNHRTKAVQLFSEILPQGLSAGIWTFAADVNMLVKHQSVNKQWKRSAFNKAKKIHSYGLYTNIEKALKVSTRNLIKNDSGKEKHVILLTDGYVDISKDSSINQDSRERVLNEVLPGLQKNAVTVHTIALSQHADHELMKMLSFKTGGQYAVINKASDLDRYFFKLFQSTTKPDTVPLKGNRFNIDKSINDMTIVLFNNEHDSKLIVPNGEIWTHAKHPASVKWVKSDNYELITVSKPATGAWNLDAPVDPDNKVMVVTNLRLHVNKLPRQILPGDPLDIKIHMTEDGKIIAKDQFIKLVQVDTVLKKIGSLARTRVKTEYQGSGIYHAPATTDKLEGKSVLLITARSPTFTREYRHEFTAIVNPVTVETKLNHDNSIAVVAYIDDSAIDKENVSLFIEDGSNRIELKRVGVKWQTKLSEEYAAKDLNIKVEAKLHDNRVFKKTVNTTLPGIKKKAVDESHKHKHQPVAKVEPVKEEEIPAEEVETSLNWLIVTIAVVLFNVVVFVGGYFVYRKYFKSNDDDYLLLDSDDVTDNADQKPDDALEDLDDIEDLNDNDIKEAKAV